VEQQAGARTTLAIANPLGVADVLAAVRRLQDGYPHHSLSLTGGEPLLQAPFLSALLPPLHAAGYRSFLETNGLLAMELAALPVTPHYVAMDIKLPATANIAPQWARHAAFLATAVERLGAAHVPHRLQVKLVFGAESLADIARAVALIAACRSDIPCILQPVTPHPRGVDAPSAAAVLEAQRVAARVLRTVRVIPQTHVMLKQW
jgi:organic radical activating enzyme